MPERPPAAWPSVTRGECTGHVSPARSSDPSRTSSRPLTDCIFAVVNIPAKVRFSLYIFGAFASILVVYFVNKGWMGFGEEESQLVAGLVGLLNLLAASKTDLNENK